MNRHWRVFLLTSLLATGMLGLAGCASNQFDVGPAGTARSRPNAAATPAKAPGDPLSAGRDAMAEGDPARAEAAFNHALQLNPNDPVAMNNLAVAKASSGDYQGALALLRRAAASAPERGDIAANLAHYQAWFDQRSTVPLESPGVDNAPSDPDAVQQEVPALWAE